MQLDDSRLIGTSLLLYKQTQKMNALLGCDRILDVLHLFTSTCIFKLRTPQHSLISLHSAARAYFYYIQERDKHLFQLIKKYNTDQDIVIWLYTHATDVVIIPYFFGEIRFFIWTGANKQKINTIIRCLGLDYSN